MISANAILIGAVTSKHQGMADRVRALTAEWRNPATSEERRIMIRKQILTFESRFDSLTRAHILLYVATACFILVVIVVALGQLMPAVAILSLPLLVAGISLTFVSILLELRDLSKARMTIQVEIEDVCLGDPSAPCMPSALRMKD